MRKHIVLRRVCGLRTERKKIPKRSPPVHRMKKGVVSRKLAPPCNLRPEFMITLPDREMLYVTRIFDGHYLMARNPPSHASRSYDRVAAPVERRTRCS